MTSPHVPRTVVFHGRVQGVGFRARACSAAEHFQVTGWVRNESDGTVRCVAEGAKGELDAFINSILHSWKGDIVGHDSSDVDATGEFENFRITT